MSQISIVSFSFIFLLTILANPLNLWMPSEVMYLLMAGLSAVAALFAGLVFKEQARDERETLLRDSAGRLGYLSGVLVLTLAIIGSVLAGGHPDPWVLIALGVMVIVRLFARGIDR